MTSETALIRALQRGGSVVLAEEGGQVYRSSDTRRKCIGTISYALIGKLQADGHLKHQLHQDDRLVWGTTIDAERPCQQRAIAVVPPKLPVVAAQPRTLLERVLRKEKDMRSRSRLAHAAMRFLREYECCTAGSTVTMNWAFVPTGKTPRFKTDTGNTICLTADRSLKDVKCAVGPASFAMLEAVIMQGRSLTYLADVLQTSRQAACLAALNTLKHLADAYDQAVRPEPT